MSDLLFNRDFAVTLDTVRVSARSLFDQVEQLGSIPTTKTTLRVQFKIERNNVQEPNKAEVSIWNLGEASRAAIQKKGAACVIEAGYINNLFQIFSGQLYFANHVKQGVDWVTTFQLGDSIQEYSRARINESFKPGTTIGDVLKRVAESCGIGMGNVVEEINKGNFRGALTEFTKGVVVSGASKDIMAELTQLTGHEWSIQDGHIQMLRDGQATDEDAVKLSMETGLIGSPEFAEDKKDKHQYVKARSLLQGTLKPGRLVLINSRQVNGYFKVEQATHTGDTWGTDWYTDIEAVAV